MSSFSYTTACNPVPRSLRPDTFRLLELLLLSSYLSCVFRGGEALRAHDETFVRSQLSEFGRKRQIKSMSQQP